MLKFPILEEDKKLRQTVTTKYITLEEAVAINANEFVPFDLGTITPGVSVNELGKQLLKAAADGDAHEIKNLLMKGAPFTADWLGTSPLHVAAQNNNVEVCEMLLRAGISKDARTKVDRTPLHLAAYEGHTEIVSILLKHNADHECKDLLGMTPLHWAVQNEHEEVVRLLMARGCDTSQANKFNLTPIDIALQLNRNDLVEILNTDASIAAQNLVIQLAAESGENGEECQVDDMETIAENIPVETILLNDDMELDRTEEEEAQLKEDHLVTQIPEAVINNQDGLTASLKLLQEHGITMLPNDDNNILSTVMESGHSVVLTDVGKEVLDSVKQSEEALLPNNKKIIAVSADEFMAMTNGMGKNNVIRQFKLLNCKNTGKRIMMKKNRIIPVTNYQVEEKVPESTPTDMEVVMKQLIEARKTIEEYKIKLLKKEKEAERYKQQLKLLMDAS
ncbi:GA-binding protein subunit beta-1 [Aethina tumida]|uniref:GA-binding protein subunit beta-1 n=1 Tax=Aethina tumida TaxID=116153 RepID=UPI0021493465|nr:GA-binding protein subunit beta-1 [Aethina tumida]XP_049821533.1 GA-binding protein subunit beta-1 [Aethina tumida]